MKPASNSIRRARPLLGTFVEITAAAPPGVPLEAPVEAAFSAIGNVHRLMSCHDDASDVSRLNHRAWAAPVAVDSLTFRVIEAALMFHRASNGIFDIGAGSGSSRALELLPGDRVRFRDRALRIDLGGIAKGFAVDRGLAALRAAGASRGLVNAGGDMAGYGVAWPVQVRHPSEPDRFLCTIALDGDAVASSGRQRDPITGALASDTAIVDPRTDKSARGAVGAAVRAADAMTADALTKLVMILGLSAQGLLGRFRADAILVLADSTVHCTRDWAGRANLAA
jgi:thiamine biosynthesis lipoprotein